MPRLGVSHLTTVLRSGPADLPIVDDVTFDIPRGRTLALVGESGCGKSMTARSIMRLLPSKKIETVGGKVVLDGKNILDASIEELAHIRGGRIGLISQDPMSSLNPSMKIGRQVGEAARLHLGVSKKAAMSVAIDLLNDVGIPDPGVRAKHYPYQFSGGMRQRIMVAIALAGDPEYLIADEPTTALDVTIQSQVLSLLEQIIQERQLGMLLITHDLGVAARVADDIAVMYAGRIVEYGPLSDVYATPRMPYTKALLDAVPEVSDSHTLSDMGSIPGQPPPLSATWESCRFAPRCAYARTLCRSAEPALTPRQGGRSVARCFGTEPGGWISFESAE